MEDGSQPRGSKSRVVLWTITLMLCSFVGGVFVGQNPQLIPLPSWVPGGAGPMDATSAHPHTLPLDTTMPTTQEDSRTPQTQPAGQ